MQSLILSKDDKITDKFHFFIKCIFVFGFLYDVNFSFLPSLTTARICFLILIVLSLRKKTTIPKRVISFMLFIGFVLLVAFFQFSYASDSSQMSRLLWFTLYGIVAPFLFTDFIKSKNEFLYTICFAVSFQSILAIISYVNPSVKALFYELIIFTSNFDEDQALRAVAFSSIGGAGLSVIQSVGVIASLVLLKINHFRVFKSLMIWSGIVIILISIVLIGRTGLFISLFFIFLYLISEVKNIKKIALLALIFGALYQINLIALLENLTSKVDGFNIDLFTMWIESAFEIKKNDTTEALAGMPIPPISVETILGVGRVVNESGVGNASGHDSGYIQTYYSLGLLISSLFYFNYLLFLKNFIKSKKGKYLYLLIFVMFVIEIKEPFIFQYAFPFFVLSMIVIMENKKFKFPVRVEKKFKNINL